jgi:hypothetical protein
MMEVKDSSMLQKSVDDTHHLDILAQPNHPRPQAADSAHIQPYIHTGFAGAVECRDHVRIDQRVELGGDVSSLTLFPPAGFSIDQCDQLLAKTDRCRIDLTIALRLAESRDRIEERTGIGSPFISTG